MAPDCGIHTNVVCGSESIACAIVPVVVVVVDEVVVSVVDVMVLSAVDVVVILVVEAVALVIEVVVVVIVVDDVTVVVVLVVFCEDGIVCEAAGVASAQPTAQRVISATASITDNSDFMRYSPPLQFHKVSYT